jgi:hypothetical protein
LLIVFVAPRGLAGAGQALAQRLRQRAGAAPSSGPKHERHSSYLPTTKET